jgi:leucyl aminopeptidase (aminopeptidase T)
MSDFKEGILNLVQHCAQVREGENVLVLNERGAVDLEVSECIAQMVRDAGATCRSVWGGSIEPRSTTLPDVMVDAILSADKVISNHTINRVLLDDYIRGKDLVYVRNACRTVESVLHPHARFHWGLVRAILAYLEELCSQAREWRITSPAGTDISGQVSDGSDVADAFFVQDAESSRFVRVFPGEVFTPVGSKRANGKIIMEYVNIKDNYPWDEVASITIENDEIKRIEGGERAEQLSRSIEDNARKYGERAAFLDSWHGGMNPGARTPSPDDWSLRGATSSPAMMHFHLGRTKDPISAGNLFASIELDGRKVIDDGKLLILEDEEILEARKSLELIS